MNSGRGAVLVSLGVLVAGCQAELPAPSPTSPLPDGGCVEGTHVLAGVVLNARDLGGLGNVGCGQLFRAAAPSSLSPDGCSAFAALGIKAVIDLREPTERRNVPDAPCLEPAVRMELAPLPIPYSVSPTDYLADLHSEPSVRKVFEVLGDETSYPVLFHCTYGRDRSGVVSALVLGVLGVSREDILRDYLRTGEAGLSTTPASLEAVLDDLDRLGGAEASLLSIGVTPAALATLRAKATRPLQP